MSTQVNFNELNYKDKLIIANATTKLLDNVYKDSKKRATTEVLSMQNYTDEKYDLGTLYSKTHTTEKTAKQAIEEKQKQIEKLQHEIKILNQVNQDKIVVETTYQMNCLPHKAAYEVAQILVKDLLDVIDNKTLNNTLNKLTKE